MPDDDHTEDCVSRINKALRFVLVEPTHPGNIGAAARAMKTMGFELMRLVRPRVFPSDEAVTMAVAADDVLQKAVLADSLREAVADCHWVIGTSARSRHLKWPLLSPQEVADEICRTVLSDTSFAGPVAVVFGRESSGLSNAELDLCRYLVQIPCNPKFKSLNLAAAVQVIAYEIRKQTALKSAAIADSISPAGSSLKQNPERADTPAPLEEVERFYEHLERALSASMFLSKRQPVTLLRRLRLLFSRTHLTRREVNILRGILSAFETKNS